MTQYIRLVFNEELRSDAVSDPTNFVIAGPSPTPVVTSCAFADTEHKVIDALASGTFTAGGHYTITVSGIYDVDGNIIDPTHKTIDLDGVAVLYCTFGWDTPVDHDIIPATTNTYDIGSVLKEFKDGHFAGELSAGNVSVNFAGLATIDPATADNYSLFFDSTNANKLSYKDGAGVTHEVGSGSGGIDWSDPVDAIITPDGNGTRDLAKTGTRFKDAFFSGEVTAGNVAVNFSEMTAVNPATVSNYSIFIDSTDSNKLKYKDGTGATIELTAFAVPGIYESTATGLANNATNEEDVAATVSGDLIREGFIGRIELTSSLAGGDVLVEIYNDITRVDKVYSRMFDLAGDLTDSIPCHFESDNSPSTGTMHVDITNYTGSTGNFTVSIRVAGVVPTATAPVGTGTGVDATVAGDGIEYNVVTGQLDLDLTPGGNLLITGGGAGAGTLGVGPAVLTTSSTTVVHTTTDQTIYGAKRFSSDPQVAETTGLGLVPHSSISGPPTFGTWAVGDFFLDVDMMLWRCTSASPADAWQFWGSALQEGITPTVISTGANLVYTGEIASGSTELVEIPITGNFGVVKKLHVWGRDNADAVVELDQPFRVACFPNDDASGREQIWSVSGMMRKTNLSAGMLISTDEATVTSVNHGAPGDLVRMRHVTATIGEEYSRVSVRSTTPSPKYTFYDNVLQAYDIGDALCFVTEFVYLPYWNNDIAKPNTLFLKFYNDGATTVKYGYQLNLLLLGGGTGF